MSNEHCISISHFSAFGPVQISWLGDTSAYVALKEHPENAKLVMKTLSCAAPGVAGLDNNSIFALSRKSLLTPRLGEECSLSFNPTTHLSRSWSLKGLF